MEQKNKRCGELENNLAFVRQEIGRERNQKQQVTQQLQLLEAANKDLDARVRGYQQLEQFSKELEERN